MECFNPVAFDELQRSVVVAPAGFRYGFVRNIFHEPIYEQLMVDLPAVSTFTFVDKESGGGRKRFYAGPLYSKEKHGRSVRHLASVLAPIWQAVLEESASEECVERLQRATEVPFNSLCTFGFAYGPPGSVQEPHLDGAVRPGDRPTIHSTIACLVYLNEEPGGACGTRIYAPDRQTVLFEVPDLRNSMLFFEQHPSAWHGFPTVPQGTSRRILSIAYSLEERQTRPTMKRGLWRRLFSDRHV